MELYESASIMEETLTKVLKIGLAWLFYIGVLSIIKKGVLFGIVTIVLII